MIYLQLSMNGLNQIVRNGARCIISTYRYSTVAVAANSVDNWEHAKPYNSIPGPMEFPLIGSLWIGLPIVGLLYKAHLEEMASILYNKYGKIFRLGFPMPNSVFVCDPKDIEAVFRNEGVYPIREGTSKTVGYYRNVLRKDVFQGVGGMLTVNGKEWQYIRSKVNPILMHPQTIYQYIEGINSITDELLARIRHYAAMSPNQQMPSDFMNTIYSWTLEEAAYIALDKRLGCLDLNLDSNSEQLKIIRSLLLAFELYEKLEFKPSLRSIYKTKAWKRFVEVEDFLTFTFVKYLKEAESQPQDTKQHKTHTSVLQQLLKIDRKIAIAMAMDTLFAGVDTTGKQTVSILYYLAKHQNVQDELRKELQTLLPNKDSPVTKEVLGQASYLKAVIKETERLSPISSGNLRQTVKDMVLSGYQIPKGTNIISCHALASTLEENYPRPLEFLPERWLRTTVGDLSHKNTNPFVTLPFGFGPRSCAGKRIANLEMETGVAKIIRNFRTSWPHKRPTFSGAPFMGIADPLKFQFIEVES